MNLVRAMATVGGLTGISRIAGFVRDMMTAAFLGAGPVADAFFVALKLPNFFRRVTAEGAFSVSFVPLYSKALAQEGRAVADDFASNTFMVMLSLLSLFTILAMVAMPAIVYVVAPGFSDDPVRYDLAIEFSRVTFPYLLFMSLTALLGGVLNAHNRFAPFAIAPVLFNVAMIAAILLGGLAEQVGYAMAWGVFISGILQLVWLLLSAKRSGFTLRWRRPVLDVRVKEVFRLMGPGVIGAGVMHINLFADLIMASFLATGSISYLYYADRLNQLPLGMVGIAVGTALLPMLSKALAAEDFTESRRLFNRALEYCFLLALPAAAALIVIPLPIITALFERGAFDAADSRVTAFVLMGYAAGLPAYIAVKVFSTAHWARHDTKTPVRISIIGTVTNIVLSLGLMQIIGVAGIALGTGVTGWLQFVMHIRALKGYEAVRFDERFLFNILKIGISTGIMALVLLVASIVLSYTGFGFIGLMLLVVLGGAVYAGSLLMSGAVRVKDITQYLKR